MERCSVRATATTTLGIRYRCSTSSTTYAVAGSLGVTPPKPVTEESADRTAVRVVMIGNVAHVVVDVVVELEMLGDHERELGVHVLELGGRRFDPVPAPHHHRHRADLAFRDPADVVLVEPLRDTRRLAKIAVVSAFVGRSHCR